MTGVVDEMSRAPDTSKMGTWIVLRGLNREDVRHANELLEAVGVPCFECVEARFGDPRDPRTADHLPGRFG